jgi:hypothetical protein
VTIDGQPVNLVRLPGLGADGRDEAGAGPSRAEADGAPAEWLAEPAGGRS